MAAHRPTAIVLLCCSTALAVCGGPNESSATSSPRIRIVTSVETDAINIRGEAGVERDEVTAAALRAEELVVRETSPATIVAQVTDEQGGAAGQAADAYLRARALPPSPDAASKYVAYATPSATHEVLVVRIGIDPPPRTDDPLGRETIRLRRSTGDAIAIDPAWCA